MSKPAKTSAQSVLKALARSSYYYKPNNRLIERSTMMKGTYERNHTDLRKEKPNFRASNRFAGTMDSAAQGTAEEGEGAHAAPGPIKRRTPRASLGASGKELRLRSSRRKGIIGGPLWRTQSTGHLSLHVRTGLEGRLPELLFRVRPYRRQRSRTWRHATSRW